MKRKSELVFLLKRKLNKEIHNEFYKKINMASNELIQPKICMESAYKHTKRDDPYSLLFETDLTINRMIDEIISNEHTKFSGAYEHIGREENKDSMEIDDQEDSIAIIPEFNIDDVVSSIREPICNSPTNRQQKKSFKYLNKFQKVRRSREMKVSKATPKTQRKRGNGFKLNSNEPMTAIKRSEFLKNRLKNVKRESSSRRSKNVIKPK